MMTHQTSQPEDLSPEEVNLKCPTDVCIICYGISCRSVSNPPPHKFSSKRPDSFRRHLIDFHLRHARDGISCTWEACHKLPRFASSTEFLVHARNEHMYDIKTKLCHLPRMPQFNPSDDSSGDVSTEPETRQGTKTPASSLDFDMANIDPQLTLMQPGPITVMEPSTYPPNTQISASVGYPVTSSGSDSVKIPTRRMTRGAAKTASLESTHQLGSSPKHAMPSSRKREYSEGTAYRERKGERASRIKSIHCQTHSPSVKTSTSSVIRGFRILLFVCTFGYNAEHRNILSILNRKPS